MNVAAVFFYLFSITMIASAFMVIAARNPVHSVLFLILAFVNASGLFLLMGAEFLAMILVVVYVGAVAVLFLFVVMMLDVDFAELKQGFLQYLPLGSLIGIVVAIELVLVMTGWITSNAAIASGAAPVQAGVSNTAALGLVLYTKFFYLFQTAGLVLLTAMIGAIVDHIDLCCGGDAIAVNLVPRKFGCSENARRPDADNPLHHPVIGAEHQPIGGRCGDRLRVMDHHHRMPRQHRAKVAQIKQQRAARPPGQLPLFLQGARQH